jgi:phospholipid transport system substrate-binding protein
MSLRNSPLAAACLFLGLLLAAPVKAAPSDAVGFVDNLVSSALAMMQNKQASKDEQSRKFHDLLVSHFDMPWISHFVLGRYWNPASEQDRQQFQKLFTEYVVRSYGQRFAEYSGETVKVTGSRSAGEADTLVRSEIISPKGGEPTKVDWRVRKSDQGFHIVDVDVEGVSMVVTQREEFGTVMQRQGGVAGLNKTLEEKLASGDSSLAAPILPKKQ